MKFKACVPSILAIILIAACAYPAPPKSSRKARVATTSINSLSANKELARRFYIPFATGNTALFADILAPDWQDIPLAPGQQRGRDGLAPIVQMLRGTFSNFSIVSQDFVAEGDKVAVRTVWTGVHTGDFFGVKGTGKKITLNTTDILQIANGKIIRTWHLEDMMGVYAQVGGLDTKH